MIIVLIASKWIKYFKSCVMDLHAWFTRIREEMGSGKPLPQHTALTFLDRIVKSNRHFRLGNLTEHGHLRDIVRLEDVSDILKREETLEKRRVASNVLGLAVVTSVNYAQGMSTSLTLVTYVRLLPALVQHVPKPLISILKTNMKMRGRKSYDCQHCRRGKRENKARIRRSWVIFMKHKVSQIFVFL